MSAATDIALPAEMPNPLTGELVKTTDMVAVAEVLTSLREHKRKVDEAITAFSECVLEESIRQGKKTLNVGAVTLEVKGGSDIQWDTQLLLLLLDEGLPQERYADLVQTVVTEKVSDRVAKQLEASNLRYKEIIEAARTRVPGRTYVSVKV